VTTGLPLYLVSACSSADEFVAAFRRYADRTGLFIPAASPLPAGRRGRLALTLKDGGVMIEGEAEILQSSVKPTVLHGRPGMTVKFVEPDEPSKQVIAELEKARLALKPAPSGVTPRPAVIPEHPRPVPPTPSGRIDAANALAECIVIGDISALRDTVKPITGASNESSGSKFVVPSIPAAPRGKTPTAPPREKTPTVPPKPAAADSSRMTSLGFAAIDKPPATTESGRVVSNATTLGMPALDRKPETRPAPGNEDITTIGEVPAKKTTDQTIAATPIFEPIGEHETTEIGAVPIKKPTDPMPAAVPIATRAEASGPGRTESGKNHKATSIGFPAMRGAAFVTQPMGIVPPASPKDSGSPNEPAPPTLPKSARSPAPGPRGKNPTTPPLTPRHPTPVAPVPIVRPPAKAAPSVAADDEKTDLADPALVVPIEPAPAVESGATPTPPPTQRSGGMRASEILAAIPAGDWTMTPDESMPHPLPSDAKLPPGPAIPEPTPAPAPPPTAPSGDWTMSLDPDKGWSAPAKVPNPAATGGNPVIAVSSDKPINVVEWDEKPTGIGESKVEIDVALMEPPKLPPALDATAPQTSIPESLPARPPTIPPPLKPMPPRPANPSYPVRSMDSSMGYAPTSLMTSQQDPTKKKKMILLAIGAGTIAVGAIVILVLTISGQGKQTAKPTPGGASAPAVQPAPPVEPTPAQPDPDEGSAQAAVAPGSEAQPAPPPVEPVVDEPTPAAGGTCNVQLTSVPPGADVYLDKQKLGTTPAKLELPCGAETKVSLRKAKFANTVRAFTPQTGKPNKFIYKLIRNTFSVKITSTPSGATIKAGGKTVGVTPTTIKLPAFESSSITLIKAGFSTDTQKVAPRQNNVSHHVTLKKGRR
jgi:hypothetical protein